MIAALREAAGQAGIVLPEHISLPTIQPLPSLPTQVGVFSGTARQEIVDAGFARDDTDVCLEPPLSETRGPSITSELAFFPKLKTRRARMGAIALLTVILITLVNLSMVMITGIADVSLYEYAWPAELLSVSIGLSLLTVELSSHVLVFFLTMLLGNGILLSYYSLTNHWELWAFLWPLEPLMFLAALTMAIWPALQGKQAQRLVRIIGIALTSLASAALPIVIGLGTLRGILPIF